jgi:LysM repeat protein
VTADQKTGRRIAAIAFLFAMTTLTVVPGTSDAAPRTAKKAVASPSSKAVPARTKTAAACGKATYHKVVPGDNLWNIARKYRTTVEAIQRLNGRKSDSLRPGDRLLIRSAKPCPKKVVVRPKPPVVEPESPVLEPECPVAAEPAPPVETPEQPVAAEPAPPVESPEQPLEPPVEPLEPPLETEPVPPGEVPELLEETPEPDRDEDPEDSEDELAQDELAEDELPENLPEQIDLVGFGFPDDGAACEPYLNRFVKQPEDPKGSVNFYHTIKRGDSLGRIARKHKTTIRHLETLNGLRNNPKKLRRLMHPGRKIMIRIGDPKDLVAHRPFLKDWVKLEEQEGYTIKRPAAAYGRPFAMNLMLRAFCELRRRVPDVGNIVVGDWSGRVAGPLYRHLSHQTGRDVDLAYFVNGRHDPKCFAKVNIRTIDVARNWELLRALLDTRQVEFVFMDWTLQKVLYEHALSKGFPKAELDRLFQYPAKRRVRTGLIRWSRGHDDHIHVRFRCPENDPICR